MPDIGSLLKDDRCLAGKIQSTVYQEEEASANKEDDLENTDEGSSENQDGYKQFVLAKAKSRSRKDIDDLVIITKDCPFVSTLIKELEDSNRKILVVF